MIYHILSPNRKHLCPSIITAFAAHFPVDEHYFILPCCNKENRKLYNQLSTDFSCKILLIDNLRLLTKLIPSKHSVFLLHSLNTEWLMVLVRLGYKNIHVVNWGHIPPKKNKILFFLKHPFLAYCYGKIKSVVVLMEPDLKPLQEYFSRAYVTSISYFGNSERISQINQCLSSPRPSSNNYVYVGNNSGCIRDYLSIAKDTLYKFKNKIKVLYMLNYSLKKNEDYYKLLEYNKVYYDAKTDEVIHPHDKYVEYMNNCDIYICSRNRQTGLAAIHTCLQLGKKMYLNGPNYDWVKNHLKCKVFHVSDIQGMDYDTFIQPLSNEEKRLNRHLVEKELSDENLVGKWQEYFEFIKNS